MHVADNTPIETLQQHARKLGAVFTVLAALMSASAGYKFGGDSLFASVLLAALLGGLTIGTAILLNFVDVAWRSGERIAAGVLTGVFVCMCVGEYGSHVAFGTSHRANNIEQAKIQNARYDDSRDQIVEGKASLEMWTARLAKLEADNAWSATVNAEALRAQKAREELRGGCGRACKAIEAKIAIAEETGTLRKQIEATKAVLAKHREKAATTEKGDSIALNQSGLFATVATGSLAPSATAIAWANIGVGAYLSLLSTFLGVVFNWLGFHKFAQRFTREEPEATNGKPQTERHYIKEIDSAFANVRNAVAGTLNRTATA